MDLDGLMETARAGERRGSLAVCWLIGRVRAPSDTAVGLTRVEAERCTVCGAGWDAGSSASASGLARCAAARVWKERICS